MNYLILNFKANLSFCLSTDRSVLPQKWHANEDLLMLDGLQINQNPQSQEIYLFKL